jgi:4-amino-4-deoxy-L-arabinose transferase-like glycosyltransferase
MHETTTSTMTQDTQTHGRRRDLACLLLLVLLATGLRALVIARTSVAARDSIGFIRYAWQLEHEPWGKVLKENRHPPLYPITIWAASLPVRQLLHTTGTDCLAMQTSAQLATAFAGVLLVIPMFFLGRDLFDRQVGFWSALLFQCIPVASRVLSDGLTEGIYLLLTATFLLVAGRSLRSRAPLGFIVCGVLSGLAYLTRPEGAALAVVLGLLLLALQLRPALRWPLPRLATCVVALPLAAFVVAGPYMVTIKGFTNKNSANWMLQSEPVSGTHAEGHAAAPLVADAGLLFAEWERGWEAGGRHVCSFSWALGAFVKEIGKGFHYIVWLPALLGLVWFRDRARDNPIAWMALALCAFYTLVLFRLAMVAGYISERHSLLYVLCAAPWVMACMRELPARLTIVGRMLRLPSWLITWGGHPRRAAVVFLAALCLYGVPNSLRKLHPTRVGFREAGLWIASHADPADPVIDPFSWAKYYAGRELIDEASAHVGQAHLTYVVLDDIYSFDHHSHLPCLDLAKHEVQGHTPVYHWPTNVDVSKALVYVYAVPWRPFVMPD